MASPLPVATIVAESWRFVLHHQPVMARLALPWLLAAFAVATLPPRWGLGSIEGWSSVGRFLDFAGMSALGASFVRHIRRGEPWPRLGAPFDAMTARYLLGHLLVGLLVALAGLVPFLLFTLLAVAAREATPLAGLLMLPAGLGLVAVVLWVYGRLAPLPVAAALDGTFAPATTWRRTRGQALRILAIQLGMVLPLVLAAALGVGLVRWLVGEDGVMLPSEGGPFTVGGVLLELALRSLGYAESALTATALTAISLRLARATDAPAADTSGGRA